MRRQMNVDIPIDRAGDGSISPNHMEKAIEVLLEAATREGLTKENCLPLYPPKGFDRVHFVDRNGIQMRSLVLWKDSIATAPSDFGWNARLSVAFNVEKAMA